MDHHARRADSLNALAEMTDSGMAGTSSAEPCRALDSGSTRRSKPRPASAGSPSRLGSDGDWSQPGPSTGESSPGDARPARLQCLPEQPAAAGTGDCRHPRRCAGVELASDSELENHAGQCAHLAVGFHEVGSFSFGSRCGVPSNEPRSRRQQHLGALRADGHSGAASLSERRTRRIRRRGSRPESLRPPACGARQLHVHDAQSLCAPQAVAPRGRPCRALHGRVHAKDCEDCEAGSRRLERIERCIALSGPLSTDQKSRLLEIAERCPVHQTLTSRIDIRTTLVEPGAGGSDRGDPERGASSRIAPPHS